MNEDMVRTANPDDTRRKQKPTVYSVSIIAHFNDKVKSFNKKYPP